VRAWVILCCASRRREAPRGEGAWRFTGNFGPLGAPRPLSAQRRRYQSLHGGAEIIDEIIMEKVEKTDAVRVCPSGCGYLVTWHKTHCCSRCMATPGSHGPFCKKRLPEHTMPTPRQQTPEAEPICRQEVPETTASESAHPRDGDDASGPWYPGKYLKVANRRLAAHARAVREAKARGDFEKPKHAVLAIRNALLKKRALATRSTEAPAVGRLSLCILGGSFRTARAYVIAELDGNEMRTSTATSTTPSWENEAFVPTPPPQPAPLPSRLNPRPCPAARRSCPPTLLPRCARFCTRRS